MTNTRIYAATVALEKNRWGTKQPSFRVSQWLDRFSADGFDGVELWENHYLCAEPEEKARIEGAAPIAIFNSYSGFDDAASAARTSAAEAMRRLNARSVKYNFGNKPERIDEYRRNLLAWAGELPDGCTLLCECHGGTVLETVGACERVFSGLDPVKFGLMIHFSGNADGAADWFRTFGKRIQHIHVQLRTPESDPATEGGRTALASGVAALRGYGFRGDISMEFTRGIGKEEDIEVIYANLCTDMRAIRECLKCEEGNK